MCAYFYIFTGNDFPLDNKPDIILFWLSILLEIILSEYIYLLTEL